MHHECAFMEKGWDCCIWHIDIKIPVCAHKEGWAQRPDMCLVHIGMPRGWCTGTQHFCSAYAKSFSKAGTTAWPHTGIRATACSAWCSHAAQHPSC